MQAYFTYLAYAQEANSENYPNIAYLLISVGTSESIHAHNFEKLLSDLGVEVEKARKPEIKLHGTNGNLKNAVHWELECIDEEYPRFIEKIKPENHEAAIRNIKYAWEAEKQHRDLLKKIQSSTGVFFRLLTKIIEKSPVTYLVCQTCGSTLIELPKDTCPICKGPVSEYEEVERIR